MAAPTPVMARFDEERRAVQARLPLAEARLAKAGAEREAALAHLRAARAALDQNWLSAIPADNLAAWDSLRPVQARLQTFGDAAQAVRAADAEHGARRTQLWQLKRKVTLLCSPEHQKYVHAMDRLFRCWSQRVALDVAAKAEVHLHEERQAKRAKRHAEDLAALAAKRCPVCLDDILSDKVLTASAQADALAGFRPKATQCACLFHCKCIDGWWKQRRAARDVDGNPVPKPLDCPNCRTIQEEEALDAPVPQKTRFGRVSRPPPRAAPTTTTTSCADALKSDDDLYRAMQSRFNAT